MAMITKKAGTSKINIFPVKNGNGLLATITLLRYSSDEHTKDTFKESITGLKVLDSGKGPWLAMPNIKDANDKKDENGKVIYHDIVILSKGTKDAIIDLYKEAMKDNPPVDSSKGL